jgi:hypothetical protein
MDARFEIGEVLLTASIVEVLDQFSFAVMARDVAGGDEVGERETGEAGEFGGLGEGQDFLGVKGEGEFREEARFDVSGGEADAVGDGLGDFQVDGHGPVLRIGYE